MFNRYLARLRIIGITGAIFGIIEKIRNYVLYRIYKFDPWHIGASYHFRPYKHEVVTLANSLHPKTVVEIGCGLGDILQHIKSKRKIGIDSDLAVIKAASLLTKKIKFIHGTFNNLTSIPELKKLTSIDLLILINWPHGVDFLEISEKIREIKETKKLTYIITDIIKPEANGFTYKHTIEDYSKIGEIIKIVESSDGVRIVLLIEINQ